MKNVPWLDETWSFYRKFRVCLLVRGPLTLWEVCGLSGKSRVNFEKSTPRSEMWVSSLTIWSCRKHSEFYQVYIGRPYLNMIWTTRSLLDDRQPTCISPFVSLVHISSLWRLFWTSWLRTTAMDEKCLLITIKNCV